MMELMVQQGRITEDSGDVKCPWTKCNLWGMCEKYVINGKDVYLRFTDLKNAFMI